MIGLVAVDSQQVSLCFHAILITHRGATLFHRFYNLEKTEELFIFVFTSAFMSKINMIVKEFPKNQKTKQSFIKIGKRTLKS